MTGPLYHLGKFSSRHHVVIIAAWILVAIALAVAGRAAGDNTSDNLTLPGTGSTKATDVLDARLPKQANGSNPLVLVSSHGKLTDSKNSQAVDDTVKRLRNDPNVTKAANPLTQGGGALVSKDKTIAYVPVMLSVDSSDITKDEAQQVLTVGLNVAQRLLQLGRHLAVQAVEKHLRETQDRVQRGAQLVAHVRQELRLGAAGLLQPRVERS